MSPLTENIGELCLHSPIFIECTKIKDSFSFCFFTASLNKVSLTNSNQTSVEDDTPAVCASPAFEFPSLPKENGEKKWLFVFY